MFTIYCYVILSFLGIHYSLIVQFGALYSPVIINQHHVVRKNYCDPFSQVLGRFPYVYMTVSATAN